MKILIAPDSFKDSLNAPNVAKSIENGIRRVIPEIEIKSVPLSDGGEGFVETMISALGGNIIHLNALDPLLRETSAFYGLTKNNVAIIEMAAASGIEKLTTEERNPLMTSTFGTGQMILDAVEKGCRKIIIGIGGSATNDGGTGMARALGYKFLNKEGEEIKHGGGYLNELEKIDTSGVNAKIIDVDILVACDVNNPLTGKSGASAVYGPQKGATSEMVRELDNNLKHLAIVIKKFLKKDILEIPGGGAAGGLGAGLIAFAGGKLQVGFEIVKEQTNLEDHIKNCDIIFTGEGKLDYQTMQGKTPWGVAQLAKKYNKTVVAITGTLGEGYRELFHEGFTSIFAIPNAPVSLDYCLNNAAMLLEDTSEQVIRLLI